MTINFMGINFTDMKLQNSVCSFNICVNNKIINDTPILFRIHETGDRPVNEIISSHIDIIVNIIYDNVKTTDDLICPKIKGIIYDISSNDEYSLYELDIDDYIDYNNETILTAVKNKIDEYSNKIVKKYVSNPPDKILRFSEVYDLINKCNNNKIEYNTFKQYIIKCFNKEYNSNKFNSIIYNIMNQK